MLVNTKSMMQSDSENPVEFQKIFNINKDQVYESTLKRSQKVLILPNEKENIQ